MPAQVIPWVVAAYAAIGIVFAAYFVTAGCGRIDPTARGAPIGVRLLLLPGAAALWPLLLYKCIRGMGSVPVSSH